MVTAAAVIIPYFQRKPGILRRAVASVLRQRNLENIRVDVIVIDDGSPQPAQTEIHGLEIVAPFNLAIIEQKNSGVAAARNAGLGRAGNEATFIAFLNSDDIWEPDHLSTALSALNPLGDFYFCDSKRIEEQHSAFAEAAFAEFLAQHAEPRPHGIYEIDPKAFFDKSFRRLVCRTPAVVYRREAAAGLRFDASLRIAGEDCLFFYQLIQRCKRILCCTERVVQCADGVNIWVTKDGWDDPSHFTRHLAQLLALYKMRDTLPLSTANARFIGGRIAKLRALFAFLTIRYIVKVRKPWPKELATMARDDRRFLFWYPLYALYVTVCFPLRLYNPLQKW